ncbi:MAG: hypothetical protein WC975_13570 [Phycisphaerae bacterium]
MVEEEKGNLLPSYSVPERYFYLMVLRCPKCEKGPFDLVSTEQPPEQNRDIWFVRCRECRQGQRLVFDRDTLLADESTSASATVPEVNPTTQVSRLIDVGQWLSLFYHILSVASEEKDRKKAQHLGYEATLCLEEALKFYAPDSDLPPSEALWVETSKQNLKERPELFLRQKLLQMREKLPNLQVMRKAISTDFEAPSANGHHDQKKHWWSKWFNRLTQRRIFLW